GSQGCPAPDEGKREGGLRFPRIAGARVDPIRRSMRLRALRAWRIMRWLLLIQNRVINRAVRLLLSVGLAPPTYALLETTGRRSRLPRQVPVANGLQGSTFWLIAGLGMQAQYVRNINANPYVRVKARPARLRDGLRMRWHSGTPHLIPPHHPPAPHPHLLPPPPAYPP